MGSTEKTKRTLIVERQCKENDTLLYNNFVHDGFYDVIDVNNDGYQDIVTEYHDYNVIHFFDKKINRFKEKAVYMPATSSVIDSAKGLYWSYRDAQYSEHHNYLILYTYKEFDLIFIIKSNTMNKQKK